MAISTAMRMGAEGIKIKASGRLGGAEIARSEEIKQGRTPLHTFRMDIDYANVYAMTVYGKIGLKVWICKGEVLGKRELNPNITSGSTDRRGGGEGRGGERRGGGNDRRGGGNDRRGGGERRGGGGAGRGPRQN